MTAPIPSVRSDSNSLWTVCLIGAATAVVGGVVYCVLSKSQEWKIDAVFRKTIDHLFFSFARIFQGPKISRNSFEIFVKREFSQWKQGMPLISSKKAVSVLPEYENERIVMEARTADCRTVAPNGDCFFLVYIANLIRFLWENQGLLGGLLEVIEHEPSISSRDKKDLKTYLTNMTKCAKHELEHHYAHPTIIEMLIVWLRRSMSSAVWELPERMEGAFPDVSKATIRTNLSLISEDLQNPEVNKEELLERTDKHLKEIEREKVHLSKVHRQKLEGLSSEIQAFLKGDSEAIGLFSLDLQYDPRQTLVDQIAEVDHELEETFTSEISQEIVYRNLADMEMEDLKERMKHCRTEEEWRNLRKEQAFWNGGFSEAKLEILTEQLANENLWPTHDLIVLLSKKLGFGMTIVKSIPTPANIKEGRRAQGKWPAPYIFQRHMMPEELRIHNIGKAVLCGEGGQGHYTVLEERV